MARTWLADRLQAAAYRVEQGAAAPGERSGPVLTRRELLAGLGAAGVLAAAGPVVGARRAGAAPPTAAGARVVVVGAGLAGLTCAYRLRQAGIAAEVHEASTRLGGRCWTIRGAFDEGQVAEHGGELIDQGHTEIRHLARELGLDLDNLLAAEQNGTEPLYWFDGAPYTYDEATRDLKGIWQALHKDLSAASYPTLYNNSTERGRQLDQLSILDWVDLNVPGGRTSRLGQLLDVAYTIEYGGEASEQSSLNLLYLLGYIGPGRLRVFGPSNEKYHVRGGNDLIVSRLAEPLAAQIVTGSALVAVAQETSGAWNLTFEQGLGTRTVTADRVVLALPFSMLRSVDLTGAGFSARKRTAIDELPMGTNAKLQLQFTDRVWRALGNNGDTFSDRGYQSTWEVTRGQAGRAGVLVDYTGGAAGATQGLLSPEVHAAQFLTQVEPVLPGATAAWNGKVTLDAWAAHPWTRGSYSYWKVGQYTTIAGSEREIEGGSCHFAGEHTSVDFQGYLNGAVESGERAASEITAALR